MSEHPGRRLAGWIFLALVGLALAVALSVTASNLSTQPIGLSGEPLRAGEKLAPANVTETTTTTTARAKRPRRTKTQTTTARTPTQTAPVPTTTSGSSGSSSGHDADDDHGGDRHRDSDD